MHSTKRISRDRDVVSIPVLAQFLLIVNTYLVILWHIINNPLEIRPQIQWLKKGSKRAFTTSIWAAVLSGLKLPWSTELWPLKSPVLKQCNIATRKWNKILISLWTTTLLYHVVYIKTYRTTCYTDMNMGCKVEGVFGLSSQKLKDGFTKRCKVFFIDVTFKNARH